MARNPNQINEDQSLVALKEWWDGNGKNIVAGVVIGAIASGSWLIWDNYRLQQAELASDLYTEMTALVDAEAENQEESEEDVDAKPGNSAVSKAALEKMERMFSNMKTLYPNTVYAPLSAMVLARQYTLQDDLAKALDKLKVARQYLQDQEIPFLEGVAAVRIARILTVQGKHEEALELMSAIDLPRGLEQLGLGTIADNLAATGNPQAAADIYRDALQSLPDPSGYLLMKMQQLGVSPTPRQQQ